ncbi:DUF2399 domain-containing protein [Nocardia sp. NPDC050710]|uniref:DUF2399 domain-containing protein n=1 Tax=Nocardia sp. NPDC050710 TaxID=3157220 RepID=UPI0033D8ECC0
MTWTRPVGRARIPLSGHQAATPWDPDLQAEMERVDQAVHEESVIDDLLGDL